MSPKKYLSRKRFKEFCKRCDRYVYTNNTKTLVRVTRWLKIRAKFMGWANARAAMVAHAEIGHGIPHNIRRDK